MECYLCGGEGTWACVRGWAILARYSWPHFKAEFGFWNQSPWEGLDLVLCRSFPRCETKSRCGLINSSPTLRQYVGEESLAASWTSDPRRATWSSIPSLLFADDLVQLASSNSDLQHAQGWFAAECQAAGMRISTPQSEPMVLCQKGISCPRYHLGRFTSPSEKAQESQGLVHKWGKNGARDWRMDRGSINSDVDIEVVCCGEERPDLEGKNFLFAHQSTSQLSPMAER